ncbi:MAG: hypothetical protein ACRDYB_11545 [Acidimicrobiales bacterium]
MRSVARRGAGLAIGALVVAACGSTQLPRHAAAGHRTTTTTVPVVNSNPNTTTTVPIEMEPCGGIITDLDTQPGVDLRSLLITAAAVPAGLTASPPTIIPTRPGRFFASVPSSTPVAQVDFSAIKPGQYEGGTSRQGITETIGKVKNPALAAQLAAAVNSAAALPMCTNGAPSVNLPGSVPGLVAVEGQGQSRAGPLVSATVVAAKGPYIVNVQVTNAVTFSGQGGTVPPLVPLPSAATLAALVDAALARVPG